jgi:hypothetical protein
MKGARFLPILPLLASLACAEHAAPAVQARVPLPPAPSARTAPADEAALARWRGGHLGAADLRLELSRHPDGTTARDVAEALIDLDVVAGAAAADGYWSPERLLIPWTGLLVKTLLRERFELDYDVSRVPAADLARLWEERKDVRMRFDHFDAIEVADVQFLCCARRYTDCDAAATAACIEESRPRVDALWERHVAGREHNEFSLKHLVEQVLQPADARIAFMRYAFFFDPSRPWEEQKQFHTYNRNIVEAAARTPVGTVARPVASNNGLHVLYVMRHDPAVHRALTEPEVEATLREKVLPGYRQRDLAILVDELMLKAGVRIVDEALASLPLGLRR